MAQIAAEELGIALDHVDVVLGDSARAADMPRSRAGSSTLPSMGPAVRAAAPTRASRSRRSPSSAACPKDTPLHGVVAVLEEVPDPRQGRARPNPTGMSVLTFGVHVVEVAVDVETGEVLVERVAAIHDVGRIVNPLGASSRSRAGSSRESATRSRRSDCSIPRRAACSPRRSTRTGCRPSRTSPRSSRVRRPARRRT